MMKTRSPAYPDLLVIGGGVIGLAAACEASTRGVRVAVLDRDEPGRGASWAAAGMLSPLGEAHEPGPFLDFALESLGMYPGWVDALERESGIPVEYRECGKLRVALSTPEVSRLEARRDWARSVGVDAEWLDPEGVRRREPELALSIQAALLVREDFRVDNRALGRALAEAAGQRGVQLRKGTAARSVRTTGGRTEGVVLEDGTFLPAGAVLVAMGAWSGLLDGLPHRLPVRPVKGQMLALEPERRLSEQVIESEEAYLVPRDDGRLLVGATVEEAGFDPSISAGGIRRLLNASVRLAPGLGGARLKECWSGFRPGTYDGNPILGPDPEVDGLFYATGHFRNGILLAPATARAVGAMLVGEEGRPVPATFSPDRAAEPARSIGNL